MSVKSLYEILQVQHEASPEVIRAAYKSLATKYHPGRDKSAEAAHRFAEVQQAFDVLSATGLPVESPMETGKCSTREEPN